MPMKEYLIDMPTMTTFRITAASEHDAIEALYEATWDLELHLRIGDDDTPIELINTTCRHGELGQYEIVDEEDVDEA
jgi:hypothetical protein